MSACNSNSCQPWSPSRPARGLADLVARLRTWLAGGADPEPFDHAVAALLVHAASVRGPAAPARQARIRSLLCGYLGRSEASVAALIAAARHEDARAVDLHRFARVVNRELAHEDRLTVFDMATRVAFADAAGAEEEGFLRLLGGLLGISDHDRGVVQHRARLEAPPSPQHPELKPEES